MERYGEVSHRLQRDAYKFGESSSLFSQSHRDAVLAHGATSAAETGRIQNDELFGIEN